MSHSNFKHKPQTVYTNFFLFLSCYKLLLQFAPASLLTIFFSKTQSPFGYSGDKITKDITDTKFTLRRVKHRCLSDCKNQKLVNVRTSRNLLTSETINNGNINGDGTIYDLSTGTFQNWNIYLFIYIIIAFQQKLKHCH